MKIVLTGGGTGGHSIPLVAISQVLLKLNPELKLLWIGSKNGPEKEQAQKENILFQSISTGKLRRYFSLKNFSDFFKIIFGFYQVFFILKKLKPNLVFSKGGYVSLPIVLAGWILKIPIAIHESDVVPGLTNQISSHFAKKIFLGFNQTKKYLKNNKSIYTGNPVREEILKGNKERAYKFFNLDGKKPIILIIGGSQGAQRINELIIENFSQLLKEIQIIHLCGEKNLSFCKSRNKAIPYLYKKNYCFYSYLDGKEMGDAYAIADLVISRAGANTLAEIALLGKASILIPFPFARKNHQLENAKVFQENNATILLEEKNLSSEKLTKEILELIKNQEKIKFFGENAKKLSCSEANKVIAEELIKICNP